MTKISELHEQISDLQKRVATLERQSSNVIGGFVTLVGLGGLITFILAFWDKVASMFKHP